MTGPHGHDTEAARTFLETLHGTAPGHVALGILEADGKWREETYAARRAALSVAAAEDAAGAQGVYVRVTTTSTKPGSRRRGSARDAAAFPGLWADLDYGTIGHKPGPNGRAPLPPDENSARKVIDSAGLPAPTVLVHSGGGLYPIWLLHEPHPLTAPGDFDLLQALSEGWQRVIAASAATLGWHYGTEVSDLARVLRLPGTTNRKDGHERPCRILTADGPRYALDELTQAMLDTDRWQPPRN